MPCEEARMTAEFPVLTFRIFQDGKPVKTQTVCGNIIKIGKLASSHLLIEDDPQVSRMHAVISVPDSGELEIIDMGSSSGTFVNGKKINKHDLHEGDEIVVGNTKIVLGLGTPQVETAPDADQPRHLGRPVPLKLSREVRPSKGGPREKDEP